MYPPMNVGDVFAEFSGTVMSIDPSGRGSDETGYAVVKMLNGYLFVVACGGLSGGYDDTTLTELSHIAKKYGVNHVVVESNFGDGMFIKLLQPVLGKIHPVLIEEVRHSKQKERRIIDTLEPVMMRHKLVMDPKVIEDDYRTAQKYEQAVRFHKMLIYQMTRITAEKGSLRHDDRLDALSMAVGYFVEQMNRDEVAGEQAHKQDLLDQELEKFLDNANNPNGIKNRSIGPEPTTWTSFR
jgi:Holliday junction resolvasome RuvABC endonuclease subunit